MFIIGVHNFLRIGQGIACRRLYGSRADSFPPQLLQSCFHIIITAGISPISPVKIMYIFGAIHGCTHRNLMFCQVVQFLICQRNQIGYQRIFYLFISFHRIAMFNHRLYCIKIQKWFSSLKFKCKMITGRLKCNSDSTPSRIRRHKSSQRRCLVLCLAVDTINVA